MLTLNQIANELQRPRPELIAVLKQFEIPPPSQKLDGLAHSGFLRIHSYLLLAKIPKPQILSLWQLELKIMRLLHLDSLKSPTWMIDGHLEPSASDRSLLLSKYKLDSPLAARAHQTNLNFSEELSELFATSDMGEDFNRILLQYQNELSAITTRIAAQSPILQAAANWSRAMNPKQPPNAT